MTNRFGLDTHYFNEKLGQLLRDINNYTPSELARALTRLAIVSDGDVTRTTSVGDLMNITMDMKVDNIMEHYFTQKDQCLGCIENGPSKGCPVCDGEINYQDKVYVPWTTCKEIYKGMLKSAVGGYDE